MSAAGPSEAARLSPRAGAARGDECAAGQPGAPSRTVPAVR